MSDESMYRYVPPCGFQNVGAREATPTTAAHCCTQAVVRMLCTTAVCGTFRNGSGPLPTLFCGVCNVKKNTREQKQQAKQDEKKTTTKTIYQLYTAVELQN